jgi:hypothetical protein
MRFRFRESAAGYRLDRNLMARAALGQWRPWPFPARQPGHRRERLYQYRGGMPPGCDAPGGSSGRRAGLRHCPRLSFGRTKTNRRIAATDVCCGRIPPTYLGFCADGYSGMFTILVCVTTCAIQDTRRPVQDGDFINSIIAFDGLDGDAHFAQRSRLNRETQSPHLRSLHGLPLLCQRNQGEPM